MSTGEITRPRAFFEIVDGSLRHYRQRFRAMVVLFVPMAIAQLVVGLIGGLMQIEGMKSAEDIDVGASMGYLGVAGLSWVLFSILYLIAYGGSIRLVAEDLLGRAMSASEAWRFGVRRFWPMVAIMIVVALALAIVIAPLLALGIAAGPIGIVLALPIAIGLVVFLSLRLMLAYQVLLVEDLDAGNALSRSWDLMRGNLLRGIALGIFLTLLVSVVTAPASILGMGWVFFIDENGEIQNHTAFWSLMGLSQVLGAALQLVTAPLTSMLWTHFYWDIRVRREAFDLRSRLERVGGPPDPPSPPASTAST
ncbi:MAG: glycerophosphoryl diester phosphodiesterase membrane domain-containing protein [bacterium]